MAFSAASSVIQTTYTANGWTVSPKAYDWTAGSEATYSMQGSFTTATDSNGDSSVIFVQQLTSTGAKPAASTIMQSYIQFKDWDNQSTLTVPSYMNWRCDTVVP